MAPTDRLVGGLMLLTSIVTFSYYTLWTLILPFLPEDHPAQSLFPDRIWAIRIPVFLILLGLTGVGAFVGMVMMKLARKRQEAGKRGA